jgi:hypothetical protein
MNKCHPLGIWHHFPILRNLNTLLPKENICGKNQKKEKKKKKKGINLITMPHFLGGRGISSMGS